MGVLAADLDSVTLAGSQPINSNRSFTTGKIEQTAVLRRPFRIHFSNAYLERLYFALGKWQA